MKFSWEFVLPIFYVSWKEIFANSDFIFYRWEQIFADFGFHIRYLYITTRKYNVLFTAFDVGRTRPNLRRPVILKR